MNGITKDEIRKTWDDLVSLKKRIEDEWSQGKRDMMRANILGLADDLIRMMDALSTDDVNAFRVASQECREHASSLQMHGTVWLKNRASRPNDSTIQHPSALPSPVILGTPMSLSKPIRVQLKRTKGWRMPENTVKVDRRTKWGNPWPIGEWGPGRRMAYDAEGSVHFFREMTRDPILRAWAEYPTDTTELKGKNLACWCKIGQPCHADVLLELANVEPLRSLAGE